MKYKLVIADVDGTLVAPGTDTFENITPRLIKAVDNVKKLGVIFSIATARSLLNVKPIVEALKLTSPIILDNGARIYDCLVEKYIFNSFIPDKKVDEVMSVLRRFPYNKYIVDTKNRYLYDQQNPPLFNNVVKIYILHINPYQAQEVYEIISQLKDLKVTKSVSGSNPAKETIHITSFDAAKEKALKRIADLSGINRENILTIGDSYNDFSLMMASGFKVAMGNSVQEIKAIADYIAPSYREDGVAFTLEKFIIGNNV